MGIPAPVSCSLAMAESEPASVATIEPRPSPATNQVVIQSDRDGSRAALPAATPGPNHLPVLPRCLPADPGPSSGERPPREGLTWTDWD